MELALEKPEYLLNSALNGKSLQKIALVAGWTHHQLRAYLNEHPEFKQLFMEARSDGMEFLADTLLDITDLYDDVMEQRVMSDNIKWLLSKRKPQVYGDKVQLELHQTVDIRGAIDEAKQRIIDVTPQVIDVINNTSGHKPAAAQRDPSIKPEEIDIFS